MSPALSPRSAASIFSALTTVVPRQEGDPSAGDAGISPDSAYGDTDAGAKGHSGGFTLSKGVTAAIIVVVVVVVLLVIGSAVLFYLAKKRNWQMKEAMRRSARKVVRAMTPKRMTFGSEADALRNPEVKKIRSDKKALARINEDDREPVTSIRPRNDEKAFPKMSTFTVSEDTVPYQQSKWARKIGH